MANHRAPNPTTTGNTAEDDACAYLCSRGLRLVTRNYRCRLGEIDLIMRQGDNLVFVEVRYRRHSRYGSPAESVTAAKQARLIAAAKQFLQRHQIDRPCRFDVVAITGDRSPRVHWIRDAFQTA